MPFAPALLAATLICLLGWATRALSASGALAALAVGTAVLWGTGLPGGIVLGAFFVPSTLVSRLAGPRTPAWVDARPDRRDAVQVLANGGPALVAALLAVADPTRGFAALSASLAAASSDTWATAIGTLSRGDPVHPLRWTRVPRGSSGGMSWIGTAGGLAGAAVVAGAAGLSSGRAGLGWITLGLGAAGMVADSVLGATVQGRYTCPTCDTVSERRRHRCGTRTSLAGGIGWVDNDVVNGLATVAAGVAGAWLSC